MNGLFFKLLLLAVSATMLAGKPAPNPKSVSITDVPGERRGCRIHIGNIKVLFTDGHSEVWTTFGKCMITHISTSGLVGWTRYDERNKHQEPVNSTLRLRFPNGKIKDFAAASYGQYIEEWGFTDGEASIFIKSRWRHGPASFIKYDIASGKVNRKVELRTPYHGLPKWAQSYADDRPEE
jgi:hypothetical protein